MLTKDAVLKADDRPIQEVEVPEWGGSVLIKAMTGAERNAFLARHIQNPGKGQTIILDNMHADLAALSIINEDGSRMFSAAEVGALAQKSGTALERIFKAASKLNGLSDEDVKELAEDFPAAQTSGSGSA
jgi:hypothetical protein